MRRPPEMFAQWHARVPGHGRGAAAAHPIADSAPSTPATPPGANASAGAARRTHPWRHHLAAPNTLNALSAPLKDISLTRPQPLARWRPSQHPNVPPWVQDRRAVGCLRRRTTGHGGCRPHKRTFRRCCGEAQRSWRVRPPNSPCSDRLVSPRQVVVHTYPNLVVYSAP